MVHLNALYVPPDSDPRFLRVANTAKQGLYKKYNLKTHYSQIEVKFSKP
jgi:hypothetical protein